MQAKLTKKKTETEEKTIQTCWSLLNYWNYLWVYDVKQGTRNTPWHTQLNLCCASCCSVLLQCYTAVTFRWSPHAGTSWIQDSCSLKLALRWLKLNFSGVCRSVCIVCLAGELGWFNCQMQLINWEGKISIQQNNWRGCGRGLRENQRPILPLSRHKFHCLRAHNNVLVSWFMCLAMK